MVRTTGLTALRGVRVGHARDVRRRTGVTVVLFDRPAMAYADHRGGWPGGYDTPASGLGKTFIDRHALFLTGGDIYGYDASTGIRRFLLDTKRARPKGAGRMPAIMGTDIYDLEFDRVQEVNYAALGYEACRAARKGPVAEGNVGAGTGATVGPFVASKASRATKGGLGSSVGRVGPWTVSTMMVSNCVGNVVDPTSGATIAGTRPSDGEGFLEMDDVLEAYVRRPPVRSGTTIGILGTDAPLEHEQLARLVELAHDGIALAVRPAHMSTDGDTILGFATRRPGANRIDHRAFDALHHIAVREVAKAIVQSVRAAKNLGGLPGLAGP